MDVRELELELERVESQVARNIDIKDIQGIIARGIWQVALQLAKLATNAE